MRHPNTSCFLAHRFREHIADASYSHVRTHYRTPQQLGLLERFHQVLKEEEVYWRMYDNPGHCRTCLAKFHRRFNELRPHRALVPEAGGDNPDPARRSANAQIATCRIDIQVDLSGPASVQVAPAVHK